MTGYTHRLPTREWTNPRATRGEAGASTGSCNQWMQGKLDSLVLFTLRCIDVRGVRKDLWFYLTISVSNVLLFCVCFRGTAYSPLPPRLWRTSCLCCVPGASLLAHPQKSPRILACSEWPCGVWLQWSTFCTPAVRPRGRWRSGQYWTVTSSCWIGTGHRTASREICRAGRITSLPFSNKCWVREYLPFTIFFIHDFLLWNTNEDILKSVSALHPTDHFNFWLKTVYIYIFKKNRLCFAEHNYNNYLVIVIKVSKGA